MCELDKSTPPAPTPTAGGQLEQADQRAATADLVTLARSANQSARLGAPRSGAQNAVVAQRMQGTAARLS